MDINTSNPPVTISPETPLQPASDFRLLRSEGIRWIQQLAGTTWTDHNVHDPGITILDLLCYAITDLSNRLDYDIKDLLATKEGDDYKSLYSPALVLTTNPVTLTDFRKVLIDISGVKNAWIEKQTEPDIKLRYYPDEAMYRFTEGNDQLLLIKGLYNISVDMETISSSPEVRNKLQSCRNVCEDYNKITELSPLKIAVAGIIEVGQTADINKTAANILFRIAQFIAPVPHFYTLAEMLAKGKTIDEIFNGPALTNGFIDDDELNSICVKTELHTSDIIRVMMDEPGVLRVSNIRLYKNDGDYPDVTGAASETQNWVLPDLAQTPVLDLDVDELKGKWLNNAFRFRKNGATLSMDRCKVQVYYRALKNAQQKPASALQQNAIDMVAKKGEYCDIEEYYSIQNQFPQVYGIGESGLPESASNLRRAQANQLKAYLLFFEQILADYFSQAAHLKDLFSFFDTQSCTYFYQSLRTVVPGANVIFKNADDGQIAGYVEQTNDGLQRKNRLLDHLIARFGESLLEYTLHAQSYQQWKREKDKQAEDEQTTSDFLQDSVSVKLNLLANYPLISNNRGKAFNYEPLTGDTDNTSGLALRIAAKLGIKNFNSHSLFSGEEGFYLLEHILLRPLQEDNNVLTPYTTTTTIERFEEGELGHTICNSTTHGLINGEQISLSESKLYTNGIYRITWISTERFSIEVNYAGAEGNTAKWSRYTAAPNTNFLFLGRVINSFTANSNDASTTICESPLHGLAAGASIKVTGKEKNNYNGIYKAGFIDENHFGINKPFNGEGTGWWTYTDQQADFYSLQLTCMFPLNAGRFENSDFCIFAENTVRQETPVHLMVYVCWLDAVQMTKQFEPFFKRFLQEKKGDNAGTLPISTSADVATARFKKDKIALRANRNSLIEMLPLHISTYPLADIPVIIPENDAALIIQFMQPAVITLLYSQSDVIYKVLDEAGQVMNKNAKDDQNKGTDGPMVIETVSLKEDKYLFSIVAINAATGISVRLFQTVTVRIGINTKLDVLATEQIDYGTKPIITIKAVQSGTTYQLFDAEGKQPLGDSIENSLAGRNLDLSSTDPLYEDTIFTVKATNTYTKDSADLDIKPTIAVRPNINVPVETPPAADYNGAAVITLKDTQKSVSYYAIYEDIDDDAGRETMQQGTMLGEPVPGNGETIGIQITKLTEDLTVKIVAVKNASALLEELPQPITLKVKPDPDKALSIVEENVKAGDSVIIKVSNTQPGVMYQLRKVQVGNIYENVGKPVYHHKNHGIGKARLETDFVIDTFTTQDVLLPAGKIDETTNFNVLATKATSREFAEINKNIEVTINK